MDEVKVYPGPDYVQQLVLMGRSRSAIEPGNSFGQRDELCGGA